MTKPFLRWAGSKHQLVQTMTGYWTGQKSRYVEPFAGSARFFFELEPPCALLADINTDLISMYEVVQNHPGQLYTALKQWVNSEKEYYRIRALNPTSLDEVSRAARFIYLNRFCFNGLYRTNKSGQFNVPYGGLKSGTLPSESDLLAASKMLASVTLRSGDFESTLKSVESDDFIYLDPPFTTSNRRVFNEYGPRSFGANDLRRLRRAIERVHEIGAAFLLSYADCPEGKELARNFKKTTVKTRRNIAGFANKRRKATELLVTNIGV